MSQHQQHARAPVRHDAPHRKSPGIEHQLVIRGFNLAPLQLQQ